MKKMRQCAVCRSYTLMEQHCGQMAVSAHPVRFNPNDKFGEFRRKGKCLRQSS